MGRGLEEDGEGLGRGWGWDGKRMGRGWGRGWIRELPTSILILGWFWLFVWLINISIILLKKKCTAYGQLELDCVSFVFVIQHLLLMISLEKLRHS